MRRKEMSFANCTQRQCVRVSREITRSRTRPEVSIQLGRFCGKAHARATVHPSRGPSFVELSWISSISRAGMLLSGVGLLLV